MDRQNTEKLFKAYSLEELRALQDIIDDHLKKHQKTSQNAKSKKGKANNNQRREHRFPTNIIGVLNRVTDVRPGEPKQFTVTITNISRGGVCFVTNLEIPYSRIVELTFTGPKGRIKNCTLEIVRLRKIATYRGTWYEAGCQSASETKVRNIRYREDRIANIRSKLYHNKRRIYVYIVGPDNESTAQITHAIHTEGYQVRQLENISEAIQSAEKTAAQLAVFTEGSLIAKRQKLLDEINNRPNSLAILAIVDSEPDRYRLFKAGFDDCLLANNSAEFLSYAIRRALLGHSLRITPAKPTPAAKALLLNSDPTIINLVSFGVEQFGFQCVNTYSTEETIARKNQNFDMVIAEFDPDNPNLFSQVHSNFQGTPIIALCQNLVDGHQAVALGAADYLSVPPSREDLRVVIESTIGTELLAATRNDNTQTYV